MVGNLIEEMQAPDQHVLHSDRHFPFDRVGDFGPDLRAPREDRVAEPAIAVYEIEHRGRLAAVIRDQMTRGGLRGAARPRRFYQHLELGGFTAWQRQAVGGWTPRHRATVELVQALRDAIDDIPCHHAIRRELAAGDRDETLRAFEHLMLAGHL